jgi:AraC family transcriptional regulator of adaptative response/methylated-DNA-[protein]-cysteine methyltransferase
MRRRTDEAHRSPLPRDSKGDRAWRAIVERDRTFEGRFVFAVRTTGVVCRPGCPSRCPRREHVELFASVAEAIRQGYRPCKKCRPLEDRSPAESLIARAEPLLARGSPVGAVARSLGVSRATLHRRFLATRGAPPSGRPREACSITTTRTAAGVAAIAYSARGVRAVTIADSAAAARAALAAIVPNARATNATGPAKAMRARAIAAVRAALGRGLTSRAENIPLDPALIEEATPFQARVWAALRAIPRGETRSYGAIAASIGVAGAARAVGSACASNEVAGLIPCHRAIAADGSLTGYRWGLARKANLLAREAAAQR